MAWAICLVHNWELEKIIKIVTKKLTIKCVIKQKLENIICYVPELDALGITASSSIVSSSTKGVNAFSGENLPLGLTSTMGSPNEKKKIDPKVVLLKNNAILNIFLN